jgi:hypothetical protein
MFSSERARFVTATCTFWHRFFVPERFQKFMPVWSVFYLAWLIQPMYSIAQFLGQVMYCAETGCMPSAYWCRDTIGHENIHCTSGRLAQSFRPWAGPGAILTLNGVCLSTQCVLWMWKAINPEQCQMYTYSVASGLIAGGSIATIVTAVFSVFELPGLGWGHGY